jgi:endonuclease YncB( thermonuclease family)
MSPFVAIAALSLGWTPPTVDANGPTYEVMQVKSGVELIVKRDGEPRLVRLLGIDTPRTNATAAADRLSAANRLRKLVEVGGRVKLVEEPGITATDKGATLAHVFRDRDDAWVNRLMVVEGYAVSLAKPASTHQDELTYAEAKAREAQVGMFSPDVAASAAPPTRYERAPKAKPKERKERRFAPIPPGGGMPALGFGETPANAAMPQYIPVPVPVGNTNPTFLYGFGGPGLLGFGFGGLGPGMTTGPGSSFSVSTAPLGGTTAANDPTAQALNQLRMTIQQQQNPHVQPTTNPQGPVRHP